MSDREKGIDAAVTRLFPNAQHGFCVYHIQKNVKVQFHTTLDGLLFKAAKAECAETFEIVMAEMRRLDSTAGEYVSRIGNERWARAFFPGRRFGHVTSNISESMNWLLEKARYLEPVGFFSTFIRKTNALFEKRSAKYDSVHPGTLPKNVEKIFTKAIDNASPLRLVRHAQSVFEVERKDASLPFRVVNLDDRTCSCGFPQEYGILAVILPRPSFL